MRASVADVEPRRFDACLSAEQARWQNQLGWDLSTEWQPLVPAWRAGHVRVWCRASGPSARDSAWAFAVPTPSGLQIGAVVAPDADTYRTLVHDLLQESASVLAFVREQRETDAEAWRAAGCVVDRAVYLVAPAEGDALALGRALQPTSDRAPMTRLLRDAYGPPTYPRPFAPDHTWPQWDSYVEGLLTRPGCGTLSMIGSVVCEDEDGLTGVGLVSIVGPSMAHLSQLAVAPRVAGTGLGRQIVRAVRARAAVMLQCAAVSLIVSTSNSRAARLYAREGFQETGAFLTARRG